MTPDLLDFLQSWYQAHCDGDWEHQFGTELAGRSLERQVVDRAEDDWWQTWSDGTRFHAAAGPCNLADALGAFRRFVEAGSEQE